MKWSFFRMSTAPVSTLKEHLQLFGQNLHSGTMSKKKVEKYSSLRAIQSSERSVFTICWKLEFRNQKKNFAETTVLNYPFAETTNSRAKNKNTTVYIRLGMKHN